MDGMFTLLVISVISLTGAVVPLPVHLVPQGTESVNGSDVNIGCASPLTSVDGVKLCEDSESYLSDCSSPAIDTSTPNWASRLVTVRKNDANGDINYKHVVLTFGFDTAMSLDLIELDLFLCPEWNIGAPYITVYGTETKSRSFMPPSALIDDFLVHYTPTQSSCECLSTVHIPLRESVGGSSHFTWHIVVSFELKQSIQWVHVGDVRFQTNNSSSCSKHAEVGCIYPTTPSRSVDPTRDLGTSAGSVSLITSPTIPTIPTTGTGCINASVVIATGGVSGLIIILLLLVILGMSLFKKRRYFLDHIGCHKLEYAGSYSY